MSSDGYMNTREYAAHRGISDSYVRRLRRDGRLVCGEDARIDVAASDALLDRTTDPSRGGDRTGEKVSAVEAAAPPALQGAACTACAEPAAASIPPVGGSFEGGDGMIGLREAMRRERLAKARSAELELGELAKDLIRAKQASRDVFTLARHALERLRMMPSKLRDGLAAETDPNKCEALMAAEIARISEDMQNGTRGWLSADREVANQEASA